MVRTVLGTGGVIFGILFWLQAIADNQDISHQAVLIHHRS